MNTGKPFSRRGIRKAARSLLLSLTAALLLAVSLYACAGEQTDKESIKVYYLNSDRTSISAKDKEPVPGSVEDQVRKLLDELSQNQTEEGLIGPIGNIKLNEYFLADDTVTLDFSSDYRKLDAITEKLTRAAIVNTLCGLENIRKVTIRVNGALLVDERGNKSENLTPDQFIYNSGSEMLNFERTEMHLYFASQDGKKLVETYRIVVYNGNIPMERLVVEQIIAGPNGDFNFPTINENTKLVNILTRDNICTVTFDKTFLTNPHSVDPEVAIYSIVNSLTELPNIRQVQIIIDGEDHSVFMDKYPIDSENLLQKNEEIVQTRE